MKYILIVIGLIFFSLLGKAQIVWNKNHDFVQICNQLDILKDDSGGLDINKVSSSIFNQKFYRSNQKILHFGFTNADYWLKFSLENKTSDSLWLEIEHAFIPDVELYFKNSYGNWTVCKAGYKINLNQKIIKDHNQVFPLPKGICTFYIHLHPYVHPIPIKIWKYDKYIMWSNKQKLIFGLYCGILGFAIIINLFLFIAFKKDYYLLYALLVFLYIMTSAFVMDGYAVYFFPALDLMYWYKVIPVLDMPMLLLYCASFLELKKYNQRLYKFVMYACIYFCIYIIWLHFLPLLTVLIINQIYASFVFVLAILIGISIGKKGNKLGFYFAYAYSIWFILLSFEEIYIQEGYPNHLMSLSYVSLAIFIEAFLLAFLLAKRFQWEKKFDQKEFQKQLMQSQIEVQEYTSAALSQELHDNIGQLLSSTKLLLGIASMEMETVPDTIKTAEQTVGKAIQDLRSLSKSLNKEWLHQFNLIENLETEKERINAARNIKVELISQYEKLPLEPDAQVMLFRVVQEALQNSIKHAFPKHIIIQIKNIDNHFELSIEDDGRGFDIESAKNESLGLRNMEHRTQLLGGTIEWKLAETKGTVITIKIPVKDDSVNQQS